MSLPDLVAYPCKSVTGDGFYMRAKCRPHLLERLHARSGAVYAVGPRAGG